MGKELYETQPAFRRVLERCDAAFRSISGESLISVMYEGAERIDQTAHAQPALFALEMALSELWRSWGIEPSVVMGHSVGEYAAAGVSGVFGVEEGMRLLCARGRLMQALPAGTMAAVFAERAEVEAALRSAGAEVSIAAVNGPRHVVISGAREATEAVGAELLRRGVRFQPLTVSHAFHSPMMTPMLEEYLAVARAVTYAPPAVSLISNVTGLVAEEEPARAEYWVEHVKRPVQFERGMRTLRESAVDVFLEIGPKPTLLGLGRECLEEDAGLWLPSLRPGVSDWQQMLDSLSRLYVAGADVSWTGFDQDYGRRREVLPTYPFQRKRCWLPVTGSDASSQGPQDESCHPLLGRRLHLAARPDELFFESRISGDRPQFLQDHRVNGAVVFPASGYVEMALAAASATPDQAIPLALSNVTFSRPLVLPTGDPHTVQVHLQKTAGELWSFHVHASSADENGQNPRWVSHASGTLRASGETRWGDAVDLRALSGTFIDEANVTDVFQFFRKHGNEYGPAFRALDRVWKGERRSLGRIRLPESCLSQFESYTFHPVLLDACFQLVGIACSRFDETGSDPWLPVGVDRLEVSDRPGVELWGLAETTSLDSESATAGMTIMTPEGRPVARVSNLRLRRVQALAPLADGNDVGQWLYRIEWEPDETPAGTESSSVATASPAEIADRLEGLRQSIADECRLMSYQAASRELEASCGHYISTALAGLGWELRTGERFSLEAKADEFAVAKPCRRLFGRLVETLAEDGVLAPDGPEWKVVDPEAGRRKAQGVSADRALVGAELALLERCGPRLAEVLQGKCDPVELLFAGGELSLAGALYETSAGARAMNRLVQESVSAAVERLPGRRRLRVLEIGAGTGGTTSAILSSVSPEQVDYVFTDVSPWFVSKARERFGQLPFMKFQVLDIERDPTKQGFRAADFDLVVAANVFHATRDLRETLENARALMKPGGLLVLLEGTRPVRWVDLVFGLTEGWWRFSDTDVRPSYPLLSTGAWSSVLDRAGFGDVRSVSPFAAEDGVESAVIIARRESRNDDEREVRRWLVCADEGGVGEELAKRLRARDQVCHLVFAAREFSLVGDDDYEVNAREQDDFERLFSSLRARRATELQGIVFLWSLDAEDPASSIQDAHRVTCGSVLHLIQAIGSARFEPPPSLWLVTRGAVPARGVMGATALAQAPLWGMARVVALEHPELRCTRLDLDPNGNGDAAEMVLSDLLGPGSEDQIAIREGHRHVARLVRHEPSLDQDPAEQPSFRADASYLITGGLGGLGLLVARWMVQRGAREIVLVGRSGGGAGASEILRELGAGGARITTVEADVTDCAALARVMTQIDGNMSCLRGVVHAAGVLDDGILLNLTWDRFERVLAPKTVGAWNLHRLTEDRPLDFFILFSSTASVLGSPGQANHAAANAYLDALAHTRQARGLPALSINWGAWSEVGSAVAKGVDSRLETRGVGTISPALGLSSLARLMSSRSAQVAVAPVDWTEFFRSEGGSPFVSHLRPMRTTSRAAISVRERLETVPANGKRAFLLEHVRSQVALVRGVPPAEIDLTRGLVELGLDSLMAIDLRKSLEESLACSLPSTLAFDYPTVEALVDYMARDVLQLEAVADDLATVPDQRAELSAVIEGLSEEEVASRLNEKLASLKRSQTK
jgi:acyl transferase domain-containing protein/acyl carrier protein/short-subunit dehydrogenase